MEVTSTSCLLVQPDATRHTVLYTDSSDPATLSCTATWNMDIMLPCLPVPKLPPERKLCQMKCKEKVSNYSILPQPFRSLVCNQKIYQQLYILKNITGNINQPMMIMSRSSTTSLTYSGLILNHPLPLRLLTAQTAAGSFTIMPSSLRSIASFNRFTTYDIIHHLIQWLFRTHNCICIPVQFYSICKQEEVHRSHHVYHSILFIYYIFLIFIFSLVCIGIYLH